MMLNHIYIKVPSILSIKPTELIGSTVEECILRKSTPNSSIFFKV
jgi:hypothetical protein